jgi:hypothetical protein
MQEICYHNGVSPIRAFFAEAKNLSSRRRRPLTTDPRAPFGAACARLRGKERGVILDKETKNGDHR